MSKNIINITTYIVSMALVFSVVGLTEAQGSPRSPLDNHRVLLVGDSQVAGSFGEAMTYELTAQGVVYYARAGQVGWGVRRWLRHRVDLEEMMVRNRPTLMLISLGGNDHERSASPEYENEVNELWTFVNTVMMNIHRGTQTNWRVLWIGPARAVGNHAELQPGRERAARVIRFVVHNRNFIDSRDLTDEFGRTQDGLHFTPPGGRSWARGVVPRIEDCLER